MTRPADMEFLRLANELARQAVASGDHPFGAILVDATGEIVGQGANSFSVDGGPGHAESNLALGAARKYPPDFLRGCTLYTSVEPCCMCAGAIYWASIGAVVFGLSERRLGELTGDDPENPTLDLPCRKVFSAGRRPVEVRGPFEELETEILAHHQGFWGNRTP